MIRRHPRSTQSRASAASDVYKRQTLKQGVIWAGTDDGLVQVTQDDGKTWVNVTPKELPEWIQINEISASPFDPATAYIAAANYKNDDTKPYLFKTSDFGKSWKKIVAPNSSSGR